MTAVDLRAASKSLWTGKTDADHRHHDERWFARYAHELLALLPHGGTLFDVGCGSCQVTTHLANAYDRVVAFDFSESMIQAARERVREQGIDRIALMIGEATAFPEPAGTADVILANGVIQYLDAPALRRHLSECHRSLAPGGVICWGLVPNARLRWLWYAGALSNPRPPLAARLRRRWFRFRSWLLRDRGTPLWDGIGHWFVQEDLRATCEAAGFDVEFVNAWYYEYRFHVILKRRPA